MSFDTLYLSQELVDHYLKAKKSSFYQRVYRDAELLEGFEQIKQALIQPLFAEQLENSLVEFLQLLNRSEKSGKNVHPVSLHAKWSELILYIERHLHRKLSLEMLAGFLHMDKYHFSREFRRKFGMSPINYVLMKKVFAAKKQICADSELTGIAYDFSFADQAHFSKTFKKFIGISPNSYKKMLLKN